MTQAAASMPTMNFLQAEAPACPRLPAGFHRLIAAQFSSALADNALLIVTMALLHQRGLPAWWAPMLKFCSTLSYVLLAPLVGPLADAGPKARLMGWMNALKGLAVLGLLAGVNPLACFALVGLGAAAYAPAKYGLVTELVSPAQLVAANAWIEVSVVGAVLLGTVLGGGLVGETFRLLVLPLALPWLPTGSVPDAPPAWALKLALGLVLGVYGISALLNRGLPDSGARYPRTVLHPRPLLRQFAQANRRLWRDPQGGLSLAVTTLFWGVGATLQFAVLRWAVDVLGLPLSQAAALQAAVAVGVVAGASLAGRLFEMTRALRLLPLGIVLGALIATAAACRSLASALPLLMTVGVVGGLLVVPMNALLQHRGQSLLSAGRSIAVQGFNENLCILGMLATYTALLAADVAIVPLMGLLGAAVVALMSALWWRAQRTPGSA